MREFRSSLATYMRRARTGERVVITVDGQAVAQLSAVESDHSAMNMDDLIARGLVLPPRRRGEWHPSDPLTLYTGARIDRALAQVRS